MFGTINTAAIAGVTAQRVSVEGDIHRGMSKFFLVGLADASVKESEERVQSAIRNSDLEYPYARTTVNLAPAEVRKTGSWYDLPIAVGLLAASGQVPVSALDKTVFVGALSLDGSVRAVPGVLSAALMCSRDHQARMLVPAGNAAEAACFDGLNVVPVNHLAE